MVVVDAVVVVVVVLGIEVAVEVAVEVCVVVGVVTELVLYKVTFCVMHSLIFFLTYIRRAQFHEKMVQPENTVRFLYLIKVIFDYSVILS